MKIKTYIKRGDKFSALHDPLTKIEDPYYIEGAIYIEHNGRVFMGLDFYDLVDQLWSCIVGAAYDLNRDKESEFYFPDQPVEMVFKLIKPGLVKIILGPEKSGITLPKSEFIHCVKESATEFFQKMNELVPGDTASWNECLGRIAAI